MKVTETALPEVLLIEPRVFSDLRGHFFDIYGAAGYADAGIAGRFVQDSYSRSVKGVLRGLHFQEPDPQGKLVIATAGRIFDVAVDVRRGSPRFGRWAGAELDGDEPRQIWIPPGFAHGFCVLSEVADILYKFTAYYSPETERSIRWNDPALAIDWPVDSPILSEKDAAAPDLSTAPVLPRFEVPS